jgi:hypothetical protein|tara:strand:+ start:2046 stop:2996 length:951 start_codon:yes stop_codon:yes gene_type:complete
MLLLAVALWVEPADIMAEVQRFSLGWMALALAISVLQVMLSAWRWQLTAGLIGVPLRFGYALREYYLALLVNQLLPGGVLGDAGRAHRHAGQATSRGSAWRAVVIERASGQVAVALLTLAALLASPMWHAALGPVVLMSLAAGALLGMAGLALLIHWVRRQRLALPRWCQSLGRDLRRGLFQRRVWPLQLGSSLTIVISYGVVMVCAAKRARQAPRPLRVKGPWGLPRQERRSSTSNSVSAPHRNERIVGRSACSRVSMGVITSPGRPEPINSGATSRCSRSTAWASMNWEMVMPPPSTRTRCNPRSASSAMTSWG